MPVWLFEREMATPRKFADDNGRTDMPCMGGVHVFFSHFYLCEGFWVRTPSQPARFAGCRGRRLSEDALGGWRAAAAGGDHADIFVIITYISTLIIYH